MGINKELKRRQLQSLAQLNQVYARINYQFTSTAPDHNSGTKNFSINISKALPSIELFIVINAITFLTLRLRSGLKLSEAEALILIAPITVTFDPR